MGAMSEVRHVKLRCGAALVFWTGYALPLLFPPRGMLSPMPLEPTLLERLFPGVPGWWVVARLGCLLAAVVVVVKILKCPFDSPQSPQRPAPQPSGAASRAALAVGVLHVGAALWAAQLSRPLQLVYLAMLAVPTLLLAASTLPRRWSQREPWHPPTVAAVAGVVALWLLAGAGPAWRSPWIANSSDAAMTFEGLAATMSPDFNLLTDEVRPALTAVHMVVQGAGLLGEGIPLSVPWVQGVNIFWLVVVTALVANLARIMIGRSAVPVAAAVFLFSPYVLMMPTFLASFFFTPLVTVVLLLLAHAVERRGSAAALTALGAVAGVAVTHPVTALVALPICGHVAWALLVRRGSDRASRSRVQALALITALCSFSAAALPAMPGMDGLRHAARTYSGARQQWAGMEAAALGQVEPRRSEFHLHAGRPGPLDVPLGTLLAPVAFPRTSLRMLGDALFDPLGSALALLGVAVCWRWRHYGWARVLLGLLAITLLPGMTSSYDRPSITRMSNLAVPITLLAAAGFEALRCAVAPRARAVAALAIAVIIAGGWLLHAHVTPRILPRSALNIALAAMGGEAARRAVFIVPGWGDPLSSGLFAAQVPARPLPTLAYREPGVLQANGAPAAELFFWAPGYEDEAAVSRAICQRWPGAALYVLADEARIGAVFAASPQGPQWKPALAPSQWRVLRCDETLDTEGSRAAAALVAAQELRQQGRSGEAIAVLRRAATRSFAQPRLFNELARALLQAGPGNGAEALGWAIRANEAGKFDDAAALATLAEAYAAGRRYDDAVFFVLEALDRAREQGDAALAAKLEESLAGYERGRGAAAN
jgi:hypothetical protein